MSTQASFSSVNFKSMEMQYGQAILILNTGDLTLSNMMIENVLVQHGHLIDFNQAGSLNINSVFFDNI